MGLQLRPEGTGVVGEVLVTGRFCHEGETKHIDEVPGQGQGMDQLKFVEPTSWPPLNNRRTSAAMNSSVAMG